jgi:hypothetical protein
MTGNAQLPVLSGAIKTMRYLAPHTFNCTLSFQLIGV